jgi:hypothetical protein
VKAAFGAEAIGWQDADLATVLMRCMSSGYSDPDRPWLAEITGPSDRYRYARTFLQAKTDYKDANSKGTRGIWFWWTLETGRIYETRYRTSWSRWEHRFIAVTDDGDVTDLTEEEVRAWLSKGSASTS